MREIGEDWERGYVGKTKKNDGKKWREKKKKKSSHDYFFCGSPPPLFFSSFSFFLLFLFIFPLLCESWSCSLEPGSHC